MPKAKNELDSTSNVKKAAAKKTSKKTTTSKSTKKATKTTASKTTRKVTSKKSSKASSKTTKAKVPSLATKSRTTRKPKEETENKFVNVLEYYDLPTRYNETVVKILAQTPKVLFVYWDISDEDRNKYIEKYGKYYFNDSYPVLLVHNKTLNYTEEVEINDFANSWYISIPDSRCEYSITLARRFKEYVRRNPDMPHKEDIDLAVPVSSSNDLFMPNDHVLLDEIKPEVKYRNVKTNEESYKSITHILKDNNLVDFYDLYKEIYQTSDVSNFFSLDNPSSGNPTSTFK